MSTSGASRRSHTKSRKGCKTCKKRHIRCDESFPQCKNCTKHQVRCDYHDAPPEAAATFVTGSSPLPWTLETEALVDAWQASDESPFAGLNRLLYCRARVGLMCRDDVRLLLHVYSLVDTLAGSNTAKLGLWTRVMPKFFCIAAAHECVMQAVLAFSAAILAWEMGSEEIRALSKTYTGNAHDLLAQTQSNRDAFLAALLLLSWVETSWDRWSKMDETACRMMESLTMYPEDSTLTEYVANFTLDSSSSMNESTSRYLNHDAAQSTPQAYLDIEAALQNLQAYLHPERDHRWIVHLSDYLTQIMAAKRAISPSEQFDYLYHLRKLLLWAPVSLLALRAGDMHSLLVLSYFYAAALRLEVVFPDVGVAYLGNFVLVPLQEILRVLQICQTNPAYAAIAPTASALIEFPQTALDECLERRAWAFAAAAAAADNSGSQPPLLTMTSSVSSSSSSSSSSLGSVPSAYTPDLSPAFGGNHHGFIVASPPPMHSQTPHSPFLQVPALAAYSSSPLMPMYTTSPLISPGFTFTSHDEDESFDDDDDDINDDYQDQITGGAPAFQNYMLAQEQKTLPASLALQASRDQNQRNDSVYAAYSRLLAANQGGGRNSMGPSVVRVDSATGVGDGYGGWPVVGAGAVGPVASSAAIWS